MTDYKNDPNPDKRLKQDQFEREEKAKGSLGMLIGGIIVLIGIIAGVYLYNRDVEETTAAAITTPEASQTTVPAPTQPDMAVPAAPDSITPPEPNTMPVAPQDNTQ